MKLTLEIIKRIENIEERCRQLDSLGHLYIPLIKNGALERWRSLKLQKAASDQYYIIFDKEKYKKQFDVGLDRVMGLDILWV